MAVVGSGEDRSMCSYDKREVTWDLRHVDSDEPMTNHRGMGFSYAFTE